MSNSLSSTQDFTTDHVSQPPSLTLASASPRRRRMAEVWGINFDSYAPDIDETSYENEKPIDFVQRMALEKALHSIWKQPCQLLNASGDLLHTTKLEYHSCRF